MAYQVDRFNGTFLVAVADGTIDTTTDIRFVGKNYAGYGEVQNENYVHLLENFSSTTAPPRPISGQIWYDSATKKLKFYDNSKWRTTGGAEISATAPTGLTTGDFWFDTANNQLYSWSGTEFVLIGPQGVAGSGTTQMRSRSVKASLVDGGGTYPIIEGIVNGVTVYIISAADIDFTLDNTVNPITGFDKIHRGLTLINTLNVTNGQTSSAYRFWGTASNADKLNGLDSSSFISSSTPTFTGVVRFTDDGYTVGDTDDLVVNIIDRNTTAPTVVFKNSTNDTILFQTYSGTTLTPLKLVANNILPGTTNVSNIGSATLKYSTVYATTFNGTATQADSLNVGGTYRTASTSSVLNTIVARDANRDVYANEFKGTATSAKFADLAEKYLADSDYDVGTVMIVGGEKEITASSWGQRAIGVISANPAFKMNEELEGGVYVALKGRVPVKVVGTVRKGDRLIAANHGCATIGIPHSNDVFAIALETNSDSGVKLVEAIIL